MEIQTERLTIVPCTVENYLDFSNQYGLKHHIKLHINKLKQDPTIKGWGVWFVVNKEQRNVIGDIGFKGKPDEGKVVEIGYGMLPAFQNKGYATEAVTSLIKWAFSSGKVQKVTAQCLKTNVSSIKVLEKVGMKQISTQGEMFMWGMIKSFPHDE
ncbi:GNAT family N-acetyltransferase [Evansella halocellulosilytica]|uniref:GNAT family N-acetyltransferase n=1 Tax=Evansella halocellulosilytica TaxID=2011013 RepID=UPI000BB7D067|nr:GNAT family N-acetyltransferase [Evansella halocellulosilytica]